MCLCALAVAIVPGESSQSLGVLAPPLDNHRVAVDKQARDDGRARVVTLVSSRHEHVRLAHHYEILAAQANLRTLAHQILAVEPHAQLLVVIAGALTLDRVRHALVLVHAVRLDAELHITACRIGTAARRRRDNNVAQLAAVGVLLALDDAHHERHVEATELAEGQLLRLALAELARVLGVLVVIVVVVVAAASDATV